ncbi:MAG: SUMF1/EgtB/PvdO family nonheme iron enzyme [Planctomycetota bacterium]
MRLCLSQLVLALTSVIASVAPIHAGNVLFGTGSNQFTMEFVTIGNPGNAPDTTGNPNPAGSVGYAFGIGKFEVSEDMINKYNANFGIANSLVITKDTRGTNKPATSVSWNEAARFVNWLNTSTGNQVAYKFATSGVNDNIALWNSGDAGYDASNPYRNSLAKYVLASTNEWYKAAFYDPNISSYWDYATGSNVAPTAVASGTSSGTAVYLSQPGPADVTLTGGLSPYGVMGLSGNVWEWQESSDNLTNSSSSSNRGYQGGYWSNDSLNISSSNRGTFLPNVENPFIGFRVASLDSPPSVVPEPSMMVIGTLFGLGGIIARRRVKK